MIVGGHVFGNQLVSSCGNKWTIAGRQCCAVLCEFWSLFINHTGSSTVTRPCQQSTL